MAQPAKGASGTAESTSSESQNSEAAPKKPQKTPKRPSSMKDGSFNTGEYTESDADIKSDSSATSVTERVPAPPRISNVRRPRRTRAKFLALTMVFVGLFLVALLSGIGVLVLINLEGPKIERPHGFFQPSNKTTRSTHSSTAH